VVNALLKYLSLYGNILSKMENYLMIYGGSL